MTAAEILSRFQLVRPLKPHEWHADCPAHKSQSRKSLSLTWTGDKMLVHCFGGCLTSTVLESVGLTFHDLALNPGVPQEPRPVLSEEQLGRQKVIWDAWAAQRKRARYETRLLYPLADLHRHLLERVARLHATAGTMPPELEATWEMLAEAQRLETERCLVERALERWSWA